MNGNKAMRMLRETNGYTQEYVGSVLGIEQNTYSKLENGQIKLTVDRVKKLGELYNVDPEYLFSDELQIINNNSGEGSKSYTSNTFNNENYIEGNESTLKSLYDKLIQEKDEQIKILREELVATRMQLNEIISKITGKL